MRKRRVVPRCCEAAAMRKTAIPKPPLRKPCGSRHLRQAILDR